MPDPGAPGLFHTKSMLGGALAGQKNPGAPGWKDVAHMESDPDLARIRFGAAYRALVERLKAVKPLPNTEPAKDNGTP